MTAIIVTLPHKQNGDSRLPLEWAKDNCPSYITNSVDPIYESDDQRLPSGFVMKYRFYDEKDAVMFALRWSGS
jgi:hypothetical protein